MSMLSMLRARFIARTRRDQRGSILVEALVMATVAAISMAGYLAVSQGTQTVVQRHKTVDIVDQYVVHLTERLEATPWENVAVCASDYQTVFGLPGNGNVHYGGASGTTCPSGLLTTRTEETIQHVTITTYVIPSWVSPPPAYRHPDSAAAKRIIYILNYKSSDQASMKSKIINITRSPNPAETPLVTLPGKDDPISGVAP